MVYSNARFGRSGILAEGFQLVRKTGCKCPPLGLAAGLQGSPAARDVQLQSSGSQRTGGFSMR